MTRHAVIVLTLLCMSTYVFAQSSTTSSMRGTVNDVEGMPVDGVTIKATHMPTGTVYGAVTKAKGGYQIVNMKVGGPYMVTVTSIGKEPQTRLLTYLGLGEEATMNFTLTDKAVDVKGVEVLATRNEVINTSRTGAAETVSEQQITAFPSISRNFQDFARFSPQASTVTGSSGVSIGGRNSRYNNIQIDGSQYNDLFGLGASGTPSGQANSTPISLDAVQEFQILVAPFDVRQGRFSAGGINAITRSGTNTWTGSAYYYFRNESMIGDLNSTSALNKDANGNPLPIGEYRDTSIKSSYADFSEYQLGARVGGPIVENKLFMFFSVENTQRKNPNPQLGFVQNGSNNDLVRTLADSVGNILRTQYGYDPGALDNVQTFRPSLKLFARLDWNLDEDNTITLRHNFVDASDDLYSPNRANILFGNRLYTNNSTTNSTVLQWHGTFSETLHNELIAGATFLRDRRDFTGAPYPSITVNDSRTSGINYTGGAENFSKANSVSTDVFEITDNLTILLGEHTITVGTQNEFFHFNNLFIRDNSGTWNFNSLGDFRNGYASRLQYSFVRPAFPADFAADFSTAQLGFYGQDEWNVSDQLRITVGLRVDMPIFFDNPTYNPIADTSHFNTNTVAYQQNPNATLGLRTDQVPGITPLFSPRIGFNWNDGSEKPFQVRGGIGLFSGRIPFVWISNQYSNTGVEFARVDTRPGTGDTLHYDPNLDPRNDPEFIAKAGNVTEVDITTTNFKMPQNLRINLAVDKEITWGVIGTIEGIYSKTLNDIYYQDLNLGDRQDTTPYGGSLPGGRGTYGSYSGRNTTPRTQVGNFRSGPFNNIIQLGNTSEGYTYSITAQLKKQFEAGWFASIAYTHQESYDQFSGSSSQAISNWRYNFTQDNPNNIALSRSLYDMPHRFIATLSKRFQYGSEAMPFASTVSVFYELRSGQPFSYIYGGDVNADGQTENDLLYIPRDGNDVVLGSFGKNDSLSFSSPTAYAQLDSYINRDAYLSANRGKIAERFGAREPMVHMVDLRFLQELPNPAAKGHHLDLTVDIMNFLNLLNSEWGRVRTVAYNSDQLLRFEGLVTSSTKQDPNSKHVAAGTPVFSYTDKRDPYGFNDLASRFQIQIGIRYNF